MLYLLFRNFFCSFLKLLSFSTFQFLSKKSINKNLFDSERNLLNSKEEKKGCQPRLMAFPDVYQDVNDVCAVVLVRYAQQLVLA